MSEGRPIVACLCAAWCRLCDDYQPVLLAVAAEFPALRVRWIDIEDEAELLGDLDVETFPTVLLIGADGGLRFAGPLTPQADTLRRLLRATIGAPATASLPGLPGFQALAHRLQDEEPC